MKKKYKIDTIINNDSANESTRYITDYCDVYSASTGRTTDCKFFFNVQ